jgi:hypothetical protein
MARSDYGAATKDVLLRIKKAKPARDNDKH